MLPWRICGRCRLRHLVRCVVCGISNVSRPSGSVWWPPLINRFPHQSRPMRRLRVHLSPASLFLSPSFAPFSSEFCERVPISVAFFQFLSDAPSRMALLETAASIWPSLRSRLPFRLWPSSCVTPGSSGNFDRSRGPKQGHCSGSLIRTLRSTRQGTAAGFLFTEDRRRHCAKCDQNMIDLPASPGQVKIFG